MEALTLETQTEETEKLLIFENFQEIEKIRQEIQSRASLLNNIFAHGVTIDQVKQTTASKASIDDFLFREQLKVNKELRKQYDAGKKNLLDEYELPKNLQDLKYALLAWHSYQPPNGRHSDKFQFLTFNRQWQVNEQALENYFTQSQMKVYVEGGKLAEFREIEMICAYFEKNRMPSNQIHESSFLWSRIEPVGREKFKPRWQWFRERD